MSLHSRSSSSAIFERDIEPLVCPSPTSHNPHRIPRAKTTELSVPSVLDSAASVLATLDESNDVAVVAPASSTSPAFSPSSGFASPIGSFRSRSPSPLGLRVASGGSGGGGGPMELLLSIPSAQQSSSPRGVTQSLEQDGEGHPHHHHPTHRPSHSSPISISTSPMMLSSHPPSPTATSSAALMPPTKRLSFMSYNDLLTSTPSSLISLSSLTNAASSMDPPPHIPSVHGYNHHPCSPGNGSSSSARTSLRGFVTTSNNNNTNNNNNNNNEDNVGGEWEREGLGKGLEERLEAWILGSTQQQQQQQQRSTSLGSSMHHPPMIGARI